MTTQHLFTLFLASPGDVAPERELVSRIVEEYNATVGEANGVRVQVVRWETDARPGWGKDGQAMINKLIEGRDHDLFVVIFWNRFGTPTPRAKSGTLEEFSLAVKSHLKRKRPEIMLYFNTAPATLDTRELDQRKAVLEFKAGIQNGLYGTYKGKTAFEKKFRADYGKWLLEAVAGLRKPRRTPKSSPAAPLPKATQKLAPQPPTKTRPPAPKTAPKVPQRLILLGQDFFHVGPVTENGTTWTIILKPQSSEEENKIRALCNTRSQFAIAYQMQAGTASVENSERTSDHKGDFWTLKLRFSPPSSHIMAGVSFNGVSADEIAQMRARWFLLGEKPAPRHSQLGLGSGSDYWIESHVLGSGKERDPILPALWKRVQGDAAAFRAAAPLAVVHRLLSMGVCSQITAIRIGPVTKGKVTVSFRGLGARAYQNQEPVEISVKGQCALEMSGAKNVAVP